MDLVEAADDFMAQGTFVASQLCRGGVVAFIELQKLEIPLPISRVEGLREIPAPLLSLTHQPTNKIIIHPDIITQPQATLLMGRHQVGCGSGEGFMNLGGLQTTVLIGIITALLIMKNIYTLVGHFLIGLSDSLSPAWITGVLLYTDPQTGKILPQSIKLQRVLGRSLLQAGLITTFLPILLKYLGFFYLGWLVMGLSLIFTYGYLVFYNMDVTRQAMEIIIWKTKKNKEGMPELDVREKIDPITDISNQIQSFIFEMVYYTPVNLLLIVITLFDQVYFPWVMTVMDCFFNTAFYYFRKWPYDKYNVAFLEAHMSYAMGYGAFVSVVTNILLPTSMSIGGYLLISQWMIINALCHTPPDADFASFAEVWAVLTRREQRRKLPSAYNIHRKKMRSNLEYRVEIMKNCLYMKSFFVLTAKINSYLQSHLFKNQQQEPEGQAKNQPTTLANSRELTSISQQPNQNEPSSTCTVILPQSSGRQGKQS